MTRDRLAVTAGVVAAGVGIGLAELAAGLLVVVPSPLDALGQQLVARLPGVVLTGSIDLLGGANRAVLLGASLAVAATLGALLGRLAVMRFGVAVVLVAGVAGLGGAAAMTSPDAALPGVALTLAAAAALTLAVLRGLLARLGITPPSQGRPRQQLPEDEVDRRAFLRFSAGAALAGVAALALGRGGLTGGTSVAPGRVDLPRPDAALPPVGGDLAERVSGVSELLTPTDDFFRIDTAVVLPRVDPGSWRLRIHGLVERELELTFDQLLDRELVEVDATIACVSNEVGGELIGTARWLGVRLDELLAEVGPTRAAEQVVGRSVDGWTGGFPLAVARDGRDALLAVAMNGEPLPVRHGFPVRLVVPGLFGYVSATKWLEEIELTTWDGFDGYWVPRGWAKRAPIKTGSRIDTPGDGGTVAAGAVVVAGVAWAPVRGVDRVEMRLDGGDWAATQLAPALSDATWVQWHARVELAPGPHELTVRAVDGEGRLQPEGPAPPAPDGAEGWHTVTVEVA